MKNGPKQSKSCSSRRSRIVAEHWRPAWARRKCMGNLSKMYKIWQLCNNKWCLRLCKVRLDMNQTQSQCCHHCLLWSQFTIKWILQKKGEKKNHEKLFCSTQTPKNFRHLDNFWMQLTDFAWSAVLSSSETVHYRRFTFIIQTHDSWTKRTTIRSLVDVTFGSMKSSVTLVCGAHS